MPKIEPAEAGPVSAVCIGVFDVGKQSVVFSGETKLLHKIFVVLK